MADAAPHPREDLLAHAAFVRALARATLHGDADSEDLEQDVWNAALAGAPTEPARQRPWLVAVLRRRTVDRFRARERTRRREERAARPETVASTADAVERAETSRRLVDAVLALEEPFRSAVILRFLDGLSPRAVAARQGVPVETARSRVRRGLARLRARMDEEGRRGGRNERAALGALLAVGIGGAVAKPVAVAVVALLLLGAGAWIARETRISRSGDAPPSPETARAGDEAPHGTPTLAAAPPRAEPGPAAVAAPAAAPIRPVAGGRVVGEDGTPVAGALLTGMLSRSLGTFLLEPPDDAVWTTNTDADGRFAMTVPPMAGSGGIEVTVAAPGWWLPSDAGREAIHVPVGDGATITLVRGVPLRVRVLDDASGAPVPGAAVTAYRQRGYVLYSTIPTARGTTDLDGTCRLAVPGGTLRVVAEAPDHAQREGEAVVVGTGGADVVVRLHRGGAVGVEVVDPEGRRVPGARVALLRGPALHRRGTADAEGTIRFDHVPSTLDDGTEKPLRVVVLVAEAEGFARTWVAADPPGEGELRSVRLALLRPRTIRGTVRTRSGAPLPGLRVSASTEEGRSEWGWTQRTSGPRGIKTDEAGTFELDGVVPGDVEVTAWVVAGDRRLAPVSVRTTVPVEGLPTPVEIVVDGPTPVRVRVLDADGHGVKDASAALAPVSVGAGGVGRGMWTTGADGLVNLVPEAPGPWLLVVDAPGAGPLVRRVEVSEAAAGPIDVRPGSGRVEGRATRLDGSPARVRLALRATIATSQVTWTMPAARGAVETDEQGRFAFAGVHDGVTTLDAVTPGLRALPVVLDAHARDVRVVVIDEAETAGLLPEIEVVDARTGEPLDVRPDVRLMMKDGRGYRPAFLAAGSRSIHVPQTPLDPGVQPVQVHADGYEVAKAEVTAAPGRAAPRVVVRMERAR